MSAASRLGGTSVSTGHVPAPARPIAWKPAAFVLALAIAVLLLNAALYAPFIADDALISLRYADRFIHGLGLTWNDGERVEGYSNLLWILGVSVFGLFGMDLVAAARLLGGLGMAATLAAVVAAFPPRVPAPGAANGWSAILPALTGTLGVALTGTAAAWTIGGLEQPLLAALVSWALVLLLPAYDGEDAAPRRMLWPGALLGLAVWTRPDAPLWTVLACLALLAARGVTRRNIVLAAALAAVPLAFFLAQLAFRLAYYHDWLPNSAHAKVAFTSHRLATGLSYVGSGALPLLPLLVLAAVGGAAAVAGVHRGRTAAAAILAGGWVAYVAVVGGDIFPAWRHLLVPAVLAGFLAAGGVAWLTGGKRPRPGTAGAAVFTFLSLLAVLQHRDVENARAREERWEWDGEIVGRMLKTAFGPLRPLLAVDPAGCVPYFSGLPSIDMLGINDRWLATNPPADFGKGWLGHELGDGRYVLGRRPDLVLFTSPAGGAPAFRSGREMMAEPDFFADFQLVHFADAVQPRFVSAIWARREGGAIGIRREGGRVTVPGHLLETRDSVFLDETGAFVCAARESAPCVVQSLPLPAGRWIIRSEPTAAAVMAVRSADGTDSSGVEPVVDIPAGGGAVDVAVFVLPGGAPVHVRRLVLERGDPS